MVGTPERRFLWILTRDTRLPPEVYVSLVEQARGLGFDVARLVTR